MYNNLQLMYSGRLRLYKDFYFLYMKCKFSAPLPEIPPFEVGYTHPVG